MPKRNLPPRVYEKHGAFYFVDLARKWHRLCPIAEGLPAMHRALAKLLDEQAPNDASRMSAVITDWLDAHRAGWAVKTRKDYEAMAVTLADGFREFRADEVTTPACAEFLSAWVTAPRMHNRYRSMLRQVLAHAAVQGHREGHNPVDNIKGKSTPGRKRRVSDTEIAQLREALLTGADGKPTRSGPMMVALVELAILTGQRVGDLIKLRWQDVGDEGISFQQGKTGARLLIEWTPALRAVIDACAAGRDKVGHVLRTQDEAPYTYWGIKSAWGRAIERCKIEDLNIHDLRGRAGTDKAEAEGLEAAKALLGHRKVGMTEHYVKARQVTRAKPTK